MGETNFTKAQIKEMLAQRYWIAFSDYERLALTAKELAGEGDKEAFKVLNRRVQLREKVLEGITVAAEALGISRNEFRKAVGCDRERTENDG